MAIVGSAQVVIRAVTDRLQSDITSSLKNVGPKLQSAGAAAGRSFKQGFQNAGNPDITQSFRGSDSIAARAGSRAGATFGRLFNMNIGSSMQRGFNSINSMSAGMGGRAGNAFSSGFGRSGASRTFISIGLRIAALVPIIGALVGALSTLVSGLGAVAAAASSAAQSLVVIPSLLGAIVQGGVVMLASFSGLGDALGAGLESARATGTQAASDVSRAAVDAGEAVSDAARGVQRAEEAAAAGIRNAVRGVADAQRSLADTYRNAARSRQDAIEAVADAEEAQIDALKAVKEAQEALTDARYEAREALIDLQFAAESGALAERRAAMDLADARWELNAASELPPDNRLRMEAQLAYEEAKLSLEMIREKNGDIAKEQREAKKEGINGSDEVKSAQERLADAQDNLRDSVEAVADALRNQKEVAADNARAIADAQRGVADAQRAVTQAREDGQESILDAKRALDDARAAQDNANAAMAAGSLEALKYQEELDKLSPVARNFVMYLVSLRDELGALRDAGQRGLFPGLQRSIQTVVTGLFPTLEKMMFRTGRSIAVATQSIADDLTSGPFIKSFGNVTDQNATTIERLGEVFGDLTRAVFAMLDAARPLINRFTAWFVVWADGIRKSTELKNRTGELTDTFNRAGDRMAVIIDITKNLWEGFRDLGSIADNSGMRLLRVFRRSTEAFADFTDTRSNRKMLREFFDDVADNFIALSSLIKEISAAFFRLGADPSISKLSEALEGTVTKIENLLTTLLDESGTSMVEFVNSIIDAFNELASGPAMKVFLGIFTAFFKTITAIMQTPVIGDLAKGLLAIGAGMYAISLIKRFPGLAALGRVGFINKALIVLRTNLAWTAKLLARFLFMTPLGLFVTALIGGLVLAYKKVDWFRNMIDGAFKKIKDAVGGAFTEIKDLVMTDLVPAVQELIDAFRNGSGGIMKVLRPVVEFLFNVVLGAVLGIINGVKNVFKGVINIISGFVKLFTAIMTGDWGKAWDAVKQILGGALQAILGVIEVWFNVGILSVFRQGFKMLFKLWRGLWNFLKPIFSGIAKLLGRVLGGAFRLFGRIVVAVMKGVWKVIQFAWKNVIQPYFKALWYVVSKVLVPVFKLIGRTVATVFRGIWTVIKFAWNSVVKPVFNALKLYIDRVLKPTFTFLWQRVVKPVFEGIGRTIKAAWDKVIKPIFTALKDFITDRVVPGFKRGVDKIGSIWEGLKKAAAVPVNFVIGTVYNNGLRKMLNMIPGVSLGEARQIRFAEGGVMPGYTPGRDVHKFYSPTAGGLELSGGEAIMRPEFTRAVGGEAGIARLNKLARGGAMKFAKGGVVWPLAGARAGTYPGHDGVDLNVGSGWDDYGMPIRAFRSGVISYVGSGRGYGNAVFQYGSGYGEVVYGHLSKYGVETGQKVDAGDWIGNVGNSGNSSAPHLHFGHPGGTYEGALALLAGANIGTAKAAMSPAAAAKAQAEGKWSDVITKLPGELKGVVEDVKSMLTSDDGWTSLLGGAMRATVEDIVDWVNDKIPNRFLPDNPLKNPFDRGGVATGEGWMPKNVHAPERVLSPRQTESFDRLVDILDRRGDNLGDAPIQLNVNVPHEASPREVVDGIVYELRRMGRGGRYSR